jgi:hypothetical protein
MNEIARRLATRLFDQPLIMNTYRGTFIEAMLEPYLSRSGWRPTGDYFGWDFKHDGGAKLEIKQAAARQTWDELGPAPLGVPLFGRARPGVPRPKRRISFDIHARTGTWNPSGWTANPGRQAQLYVFAYHGQISGCDQRRPDQWEFFTVPTADLDAKLPAHKSVGLTWLRAGYRSVVGSERCAEQVSAWLLQRAPQL